MSRSWFIGGPLHGENRDTDGRYAYFTPARTTPQPWTPGPIAPEADLPQIVTYKPFRWSDGRSIETYWLCDHHEPQAEGWGMAWPNIGLCECTAEAP